MRGFFRAMPLALSLMAGSASAEPWQVEADAFPAPSLEMRFGEKWKVSTRGRAEMDAVSVRGDTRDYDGGIYDRRMRGGLDIAYGEHWTGTIELDFAGTLTHGNNLSDASYTDVVLEYDDKAGNFWQFGHFKEHFGQERVASSGDTLFLERAAIDAFTPHRNLGVQYTRYSDRASLSLGVFTDSMQTNSNKERMALTGRGTYSLSPWGEDTLHLGGAVRLARMDQVRFASGPDTSSIDDDVIDTGKLRDVDRLSQYGLELGYAWRNFLWRNELMLNQVSLDTQPDATLYGWYSQVSWVVTGEDYRYSAAKNGIFLPVVPHAPFDVAQNQWGAVELGARYQAMNLNSGAIRGGIMHATSASVNWYLNEAWRVTGAVSYITSDAEAALPNEEMWVTGARIRWKF